MVDEKAPPAKQGLHGWRAAAAVFGCGSLAAFGVFGAVVGALSMLISTASSGIGPSESQLPVSAQSAQPREELEPGALDICSGYLPEVSDIEIDATLASSHKDDAQEAGFNPSGARVVEGQCSFEVTPQYGTSGLWKFDFDFEALIHDPDRDRDQVSSEIFQERLADAGSMFESVETESDNSWADASRSFYGESPDGVSRYLVVSQTRSSVYTLIFSGVPSSEGGGVVSENDFARQSEALVGRLHERFFRVIPE
ncbi:hypothetical protein HFP72_21855 [Nocardiopsis sp. ARC36]